MRFFEKLGALENGGKTSVEDLFSSHPATEERIRDLEARIERASDKTGQRSAHRYMREAAPLRRAVIGTLLGIASTKFVKWAEI